MKLINAPKVSIVTPVLNGEKFIMNNINSVLKLTIPFEHIIVDGGSTDNTLSIISGYPHVKLLNQGGKNGMYEAIDQGFLAGSGEFLAYVNSDDLIVREGFEKMYFEISKTADLDLVYSDSLLNYKTEGKSKRINGLPFAKFLLSNGIMPFIQPSSIYRKSTYLKVGKLNYQNFRICGDLDFFHRMCLRPDFRYKYVPYLSTIFLIYGQSLGDRNTDLYFEEIKKNGLPIPGFIIRVIRRSIKIYSDFFFSHN